LGTASWKEHKYSSFCESSKRCEENWGSTHQQRQLVTVCDDDVFHRNFSSAGWTDQCVLPQHLDRQARPSRWLPDIMLLDMMIFIALALQIGHERHTTWLLVETKPVHDLPSFDLKFILITSQLHLGLWSRLLPSGFPLSTLYAFPAFHPYPLPHGGGIYVPPVLL
jgi:hypothetical protein